MRWRGRSWRWGVVAAVVGALLAAPAIVAAWPVPLAARAPEALLAQVRTSADTPYEAYVATRGRLRLPDFGPLDEVASLFGTAIHLRAWVGSAERWRVDRLHRTGEVDTYRDGEQILIWDSAERLTTRRRETTSLRLPRPADLLPAELGRRLVAAIGPADRVTPIAARRVAGRPAAGLRIVPASAASTIAHAELWIDQARGLPLAVDVTAEGEKSPAISVETLTIAFGPPDPAVLTFEPPIGTGFRTRGGGRGQDLVAQIERSSPVELPDSLGGLARNPGPSRGVATYGRGFETVTLLGAPRGVVPPELTRRPVSRRPWGGDAILIETSLIKAELFGAGENSYLVAGAVDVAELDRLAGELVAGTRPEDAS